MNIVTIIRGVTLIEDIKYKKGPFCIEFVDRRYDALFGCLYTKL